MWPGATTATLVIDADFIIRPHSPDVFDIVPQECVGAMPEGGLLPRDDCCRLLRATYGLGERLTPAQYFNSGVLVLSKPHLGLLESLGSDTLYGQPNFEQGHLNAKRVSLGLSLFRLPPDFNFLPDSTIHPVDWRYAFFPSGGQRQGDLPLP